MRAGDVSQLARAPGAADWEIQPRDYVNALQLLMERASGPIVAVLTAQNGASTTLNGWIQSALLGVKVLDAAGLSRDNFMAALRARNVGTGLHFRAVHTQPYYTAKYPGVLGTRVGWRRP